MINLLSSEPVKKELTFGDFTFEIQSLSVSKFQSKFYLYQTCQQQFDKIQIKIKEEKQKEVSDFDELSNLYDNLEKSSENTIKAIYGCVKESVSIEDYNYLVSSNILQKYFYKIFDEILQLNIQTTKENIEADPKK